MDENAKKIQREIAKDKIQVILSSIALAVLVVMNLYIMINFKSNFIAMAVGILLMIVALFFLISALMDMSLKQKDIEQEKYEEIYNATKASYLVIKKSFDEMEQRLQIIEQNSSLPAEDIINAQKAVAKVTISRSKENTDALMNSNDELINQLVNIQEKLESSNSQILEKQQTLLKESNLDLQQKINELTSQISNIQGRIQSGIPVMAQPIQMASPMPQMQVQQNVMPAPEMPVEPQVEEETYASTEDVNLEPVAEEISLEEPAVAQATEEIGIDIDSLVEENNEEITEDIGIDIDTATEEITEDVGIDIDTATEEITEDVGLDIDSVTEEASSEVTEDLGLDLDMAQEVTDDALDIDAVTEATVEEEIPTEEIVAEEPIAEEPIVEEAAAEESVVEEPVVEEPVAEETAAEEPVVEEPIAEEQVDEKPVVEEVVEIQEASEVPSEDPGAGLDALLEEIGESPEPEPEPEPVPEPTPEPEPEKSEDVVIPDVGVDLTDPNRVMSPEEIEKLFASI